MMQPKVELLTDELVQRILDEAYQLLTIPGVKVQSAEARTLLAEAGAQVDQTSEVASIPRQVVEKCLASVPHQFYLYDRDGNPTVNYGGDAVQFDPGSSGVHILDPDTLEHKPSVSADLVRLIKVTEMLPQYDAQSTAVVCNDVPKVIGDLYRLYLVLLYSKKPIVTGAFSVKTLQAMIDMMAIFADGRIALEEKPQAVFDVCPSPPLIWSDFGAQNLIERGVLCPGPDRLDAPGRGSRPGHPGWVRSPARRRMPERHHHPPACQAGSADRLGWSAGYLRYAQGHDPYGSHRDRYARRRLRPGW
jgi:trimethylamine--corrinoid protein Co-methyltransferase